MPSDWIAAILKPHQMLAISRSDSWKFQLHVVFTIDHIGFYRNQQVHNAPSNNWDHTSPNCFYFEGPLYDLDWLQYFLYLVSTTARQHKSKLWCGVLLLQPLSLVTQMEILLRLPLRDWTQSDAAIGEAHATLLTIQTTSSSSCGANSLILKGMP